MKLFIFLNMFFLIVVMEMLYLKQPSIMKNFNNTLIDSAFIFRGQERADARIMIVDVDEKSLAVLGQWPWSRDKVATILENLTAAGVGIIGLDMVFAEEDSSSPSKIAKAVNLPADALPDYDKILANTLLQTPTITGFVFNFEDRLKNAIPNVNAIYIQKGKKEEALLKAKGITANLSLLEESAYSSGSFNTLPDSDGVVRYVPLVFSYEESVYPSLSFEMIRVMLGAKKVMVHYDENGVSGLEVGDLQIPTDGEGRLFVNYRGGERSYRYISALDVYHDSFDKAAIEGSIVLLGTSAVGLLDLRAMPFDSSYPGVEVHANAIDNMLNNNIISAPSYVVGIDMVAIAASIMIVWILMSFASPLLSFGLLMGALGIAFDFYYGMLFEDKLLLNFSYPLLSVLSATFVMTFFKIYHENRQKEMISDKFSKKVSPQVAQKLLKSEEDVFSASETEVTIFFSDIRNFTSISEGFADPKVLINYLNTYMAPMSQIIIDYEGTIDKYIGDAIMAYWNAPIEVEMHADKAVMAALKQIDALSALNEILKSRSEPIIDIGIGIHTGNAIVGEMGSKGRSDYTAIGDSINLGSRIEGLCKTYGAKILITEHTKERLQLSYRMREVDRVQVKGKEEAVTIYEVLEGSGNSVKSKELDNMYQKARESYKAKAYQKAYGLYYKAYEIESHKLFALYMDRCASLMKEDAKAQGDVYKFTSK